MLTLMGIIAFHFLVMLISKHSDSREAPYMSAIIVSVLLTGYVFYMLVNMEDPRP